MDGRKLTWMTSARGIAFAIEGPDYLTVASTKADRMLFPHVPRSAEQGHYDKNGNWQTEKTVSLTGEQLVLEACKIYRIKL